MSLQQLYQHFERSPRIDEKSLMARGDTEGRQPGATAESLERLSRAMIEVQHSEMDPRVAPTWDCMSFHIKSLNESLPTTNTRDQLISNLASRRIRQPGYKLEIMSLSSNVDEVHGRATVYSSLHVRGLGCGHRREAIATFHWEKKQGQWLCIKHVGFRGSAGFP